ncbi:MAG: hypothetical protein WD995_09270 [Gemmatimonadota bacterium]
MTMVDWLLTEQLVEIFREAGAKRDELNATLEARSPLGEEDVLAGAGAAVRIETTDGAVLVVTPRRIQRAMDERGVELVRFEDLVGYDWISPEMSDKVEQKDAHWDRLYLYPRGAPPITLAHLGEAVYPLMTFLGRVLEFQSEKVLLRKLDDDVVELLGQCLMAAASGPFFTDRELADLFRRSRHSLSVVAGLWPKLNLAAPDVLDLLERVVDGLLARADVDPEAWRTWVGAPRVKVEAALEVFRRVSSGEV